MFDIKNTDIIKAQADDAASDLNVSALKTKGYMDQLLEDLKNKGADASFTYRGDLLDSLEELSQGITILDALKDLVHRFEELEKLNNGSD